LHHSPRNRTLLGGLHDDGPEPKGGDPAGQKKNANGTNRDFGENGVVFAREVHYHRNLKSDRVPPAIDTVGNYWLTGEFRVQGHQPRRQRHRQVDGSVFTARITLSRTCCKFEQRGAEP
jgi:hypothetical protein